LEELNGLIERIKAETVWPRDGKVKEGRERAVIEGGTCVIESEVWGDRDPITP
jgi:hypothetical protein